MSAEVPAFQVLPDGSQDFGNGIIGPSLSDLESLKKLPHEPLSPPSHTAYQTVLIFGGVAAGSIACTIPPEATTPTAITQRATPTPFRTAEQSTLIPLVESQTATKAQKELVEKKFGVRLTTLKDFYNKMGWEYRAENYPQVPLEWDKERLMLLDSFLSTLPAYLIESNSTRGPLEIQLQTTNDYVSDYPGGHSTVIGVAASSFDPRLKRLAFSTFTQQLVGAAIPPARADTPAVGLGNPNNLHDIKIVPSKSPWYDKVNSVFGEDFALARERIKKQIIARENELYAGTSSRDPQIFYMSHMARYATGRFYKEVSEALRGDLPVEFIEQLGKDYAQGKRYFFTMYGDIFSPEVVRDLYQFVKGDIFMGVEYADSPFL